MSAVTKEDVARLHAYLVVPMGVSEALSKAEPLEGETQYALHVALSEIDPDSALLAIALSAYRIAQDFAGVVPVAAALKYESDKIIQDYAPDWLAHYHDRPPVGDDLFDLLMRIPEDLESLADLLETMQASIRDENHPAHALCAVLSIQARAHMEIADYVLTEMENANADEPSDMDGICGYETPVLFEKPVFEPAPENNVILFPIHRCRQKAASH